MVVLKRVAQDTGSNVSFKGVQVELSPKADQFSITCRSYDITKYVFRHTRVQQYSNKAVIGYHMNRVSIHIR